MADGAGAVLERVKLCEDLIYDVGQYDGDDTAYYLAQGYRVVGIEADPTLAEKNRQRFAREIEQGRVTVVNVGIAEENGTAEFWICETNPSWNSFDRSISSRYGAPHHAITVPTRRFAEILAEHGIPYYLKIDIEGSDKLCVRDLSAACGGVVPRYISLESECVGEGKPITEEQAMETLRLLRAAGYQWFKLIDQSRMSTLTVPSSWRDRVDLWATRFAYSENALAKAVRAVGLGAVARRLTTKELLRRRFGRNIGSGSGVWGEETLGAWMDYAEAERTLLYHRRMRERKATTPYFFWCDWHRRSDGGVHLV